MAELPHIAAARRYIGEREIKGSKHNPKIIRLRELAGTGIKNDEAAWCADFVGGCLGEVGFKNTGKATARSFMNWGQKLDAATYGSVVVFWRGSRKGWMGHVGFVVGRDRHGNLMVLGGNQGDAVNIKPFSRARLLGYRWPKELPLPTKQGFMTLPVLRSDGRVSTNEA